MTKTFIMTVAAAMAIAGQAATAATLLNGDFENGPGPYQRVLAGETTLTDWTVTGGGIDIHGDGDGLNWEVASGAAFVDLNHLSAGGISQQIDDFIVGQDYTLTFEFASNPGFSPNNILRTMNVGVNFGTSSPTQSYGYDAASSTFTNMNWTDASFAFTATATSGMLFFQSTTASPFGPAIDNLTLTMTAVPLPASALLLFGGLAAMGALRRRQMAT